MPAACQPAGLTANCQSTHAHRYEGLTGRGRLCSPTKKFLAVVSVKAVRLEEVMLSLQAVQPEKCGDHHCGIHAENMREGMQGFMRRAIR